MLHDLTVALWRFCNNLDPKRDRMLVQQPSATMPDKTFACMGLGWYPQNKRTG
jgi:4-hydroxy-3-polyprenylbenzoate decarboxylase